MKLASCPRCGGTVVDAHHDSEPYCLQCGWFDRNWSPAMMLDVDEEVAAHIGYNTIGVYANRIGLKVREA